MLYTTFALAHKNKACPSSYRKMGEALGGIAQYGKDTPIPLDKVLEVCGFDDTIWALRCTTEPSADLLIEFSCQCAEHVLPLWTDTFPDDARPQKAIQAARNCITDKSSAAAWAAWSAAWAAAGDAAGAAAGAARDAAGFAWAAGAAERQWQHDCLLKLMGKEVMPG